MINQSPKIKQKLGMTKIEGIISKISNESKQDSRLPQISNHPILGDAKPYSGFTKIELVGDNNHDLCFLADVPITWIGDRIKVRQKEYKLGDSKCGTIDMYNIDRNIKIGAVYDMIDPSKEAYFKRELDDFNKNQRTQTLEFIDKGLDAILAHNDKYYDDYLDYISQPNFTNHYNGKIISIENNTKSFGPKHTENFGMMEEKKGTSKITIKTKSGETQTLDYVGTIPNDWVGTQIKAKEKQYLFQGKIYGRIGITNNDWGDEIGVGFIKDRREKKRYLTNPIGQFKKKTLLNRNYTGTYEIHQIAGNDTIDPELVKFLETTGLPVLHGEFKQPDNMSITCHNSNNQNNNSQNNSKGLISKLKSFF